MRTLSTTVLLLFFMLTYSQKTVAQTQPPSFREMERQMLEMQQQLMEQLRNNPFNDPNFAMPQWDTTFFFRLDTTIEGGSMSQFFHFSPFGGDSTNQDDFWGFGRMFEQFFNPDGQFEQPDYGIGDFPQDDGDKQKNGEELLPEERLRQQEETEKTEKKQAQPAPKSAEPKPDPKVKTIRI
jgi:hypothetical protein